MLIDSVSLFFRDTKAVTAIRSRLPEIRLKNHTLVLK